MREVEFKMERPGLVEAGQTVEITEHEALSGCSYIIEPAVAMSAVKEIKHNDRGYYVIVNFDE